MKNVLVINKKREYNEQCGSQNEKYTPYNENFAEDRELMDSLMKSELSKINNQNWA